ncbi:MAG: hypothetical protein KatS3mg031_0312 [Chitinophagales bacterium]|nr:MAG: hypothetical protein KatS3mg031_0312 [Chitinophagales bacterium]
MSGKTEPQYLADAFESVRQLTRWYISKLKGVDLFHEFELEGKKLNCAYWIIAHLVWAENFLLLRALGGEAKTWPWLERFALGSAMPDNRSALPDIKTLLNAMKETHHASMLHVRGLSQEMLNRENPFGLAFGQDNSYRMMIHHAIRHEAMHTGHLSWLCKLYGLSTV